MSMAGFARGLADKSIIQLSDTFSMKHQTATHTHLCIYISVLFSVSPEKMVLSKEGSDKTHLYGLNKNRNNWKAVKCDQLSMPDTS